MARVLGIDIRPHSVRAALVRSSMRSASILSCYDIPFGEANEDNVQPSTASEAIRFVVKQIASQLGQSPDMLIVGLAGHEASLRVLEIPSAAMRRVQSILPFELEALLPFPVENAAVDFQPIDTKNGVARILAAAVPRKNLESLITTVAEARSEAREIAVGASALDGLAGLLPDILSNPHCCIIEISEESSDICILRKGRCEYARTISHPSIHKPAFDAVFRSGLMQTFASYHAIFGASPADVYLCGDFAQAPLVQSTLGSLNLIPRMVPLAPIENIDPGAELRFAKAASLGARVLLRGKRFNLRQGEFALRRTVGALRSQAKLLAVCGSVILVALCFSLIVRWKTLISARERLEAQLAQISRQVLGEETRDPVRAQELMAPQSNADDPLPHTDAFDLLHAISNDIPGDVTHNAKVFLVELGLDGVAGRFEIEGSLPGIAKRDELATKIGSHPCIKDLEKGKVSPGVDSNFINYQLHAVLQCPGDGRKSKNSTLNARGANESP